MRSNHFIFVALAVFLFSPLALANSGAFLDALGGSDSVTVKRAGKQIQLKKGDFLEFGDEINTGKSTVVDVRLKDRTVIRVGANSSYRLESDSGNQFFHRLLTGLVRVVVPANKDKDGKVKFRMNTPEGTIGVRGTEFVVDRTKDETTLRGLEGIVLFGPGEANFENQATFKEVKAGFMSTVRKGKGPSDPSSYPMDKYLKELDSAKGPFGALAWRNSGKQKARATDLPAVAEKAPLLAAAPKLAPRMKPVIAKPNAPTEKTDVNQQLFVVAGTSLVDQAEALIKKGADPKKKDEKGFTPLHYAVGAEQVAMINHFMSKSVDVNAKSDSGETPLMSIAHESGSAILAALLVEEYKAKVGEKDKQGLTALDIARLKLGEKKAEGNEASVKKYEELVQYLEEVTR